MSSVLQNFEHLHGFSTVFEDGVVKVKSDGTQANTDALTILYLGTAIDGPKGKPIQATKAQALDIFGGALNSKGERNGATLPVAVEATSDAGANNIVLVRISGEEAIASIEAPTETEVNELVYEQTLGQAKGYEVDLAVDNVKFATIKVVAVNKLTGVERIIGSDKYDLIEKSSLTGHDLLVITGTAFNNDEDIIVTCLHVNKIGEAGSSITPITESNLTFTPNGEGFKVTLADKIYELFSVKTIEGKAVDMKDTTIIDNAIFFSSEENLPKSKAEQSFDIEKVSGKLAVKLDKSKGKPVGQVKVYHDSSYPLTAGVVIGEFDIKHNKTTDDYYVDLTDVALKENLADVVSTDEEIKVLCKYSYIPSINVEYFTTNGDKEQELSIEFSEEERFEEFVLEQSAKELDKLYLYIDDSELLNRDMLKLIDGNKLKVSKTCLPKGADLSVRFAYDSRYNFLPKIEFKTVNAGAIYNETTIAVDNIVSTTGAIIGKRILIDKPSSKKNLQADKPTEFSSLQYSTFDDLCTAINETMGYFLTATTKSGKTPVSLIKTQEKKFFFGGDDGVNLSKDEIYKILSGTRNSSGILLQPGLYQLLEGVKADIVVPLGVYADDELTGKYQNFAQELAMFCANASQANRMIQGFISYKPVKDMSMMGIQQHASALTQANNEFYVRNAKGEVWTNKDGKPEDIGRWIITCAGPEPIVFSERLGTFKCNNAIIAAALNATIPTSHSSSQKRLPSNVKKLSYNFSNPQANSVVGNRIYCFGLDEDGYPIVIDGCTAAREGSKYGRISIAKIIRKAMNVIKKTASPMLGEPISVEEQNSLTGDISKELGILVLEREFEAFEFSIIYHKAAISFKDAKIELSLKAFDEFRKITTVINLAD